VGILGAGKKEQAVEAVGVGVDARGVACVTLRRAGRHNALDAAIMDGLTAAAARLGADPGVRAVVLEAEGETFCAGGDLGWMRAQVEGGAEARGVEARRLAGMLAALNACPKPLIARVQGNAFGGGVGLISVCDIAVGVTGARFALTETRLGLIPATIAPYVLARIGAAAMRRHALTGSRFGAGEAVALGLLSAAVDPADLDEAVAAEVDAALAAAPGAIADTKALIARLAAPVTSEMVEASIAALAARWETAEAAEGIAAFFARTPPPWAR
jgi:methylglutaconyl-CoA hydratase